MKALKYPDYDENSKESDSMSTDSFHSRRAEDVLQELEVDPVRGLALEEVKTRQERWGKNELEQAKGKSAWTILLDQFKSLLVVILAGASVLAFVSGRYAEGIAIVGVLVVNGAIGFVSEWRAVRSMEALRKLGKPSTRVLRDGKADEIAVAELVPGDMVLFEGGDMVPADLRVVEANSVVVDESPLTGESVPVPKDEEPVKGEALLAERSDMLFKGTTVVGGSGSGVVVATGMDTEIGNIAAMTAGAESEITPLEKRLNTLGTRLAVVSVSLAVIIALIGIWAGQPAMVMVQTAIALGVAAIPEGLPIVATIALARGMWMMARKQAIINRLTAVETLGSADVIFTDKTGTLTENRMALRKIRTASDELDAESPEIWKKTLADDAYDIARRIMEIGVLCNNASLSEEEGELLGDPTEVALLEAGRGAGINREELLREMPEEREVPFDPEVMMMATYHRDGDGYRVAVKGAPRSILGACTAVAGSGGAHEDFDEDKRRTWKELADDLALEGLRVLGVAEKQVQSPNEEPYENLVLLGLAGLLDPPREDVEDALEACRAAGIEVVMVTGDSPPTASAIAGKTGLVPDEPEEASALAGGEIKDPEDVTRKDRKRYLDESVFARVSPEQKLNLLSLYQEAGHTVAMTGDGINDVPALKKADIGVAMGKRGTDAAREAADMVLKDDAFPTIVAAVKQGRIIFANIRKSALFMLCTNAAEILAVAAASFAGAPLPLRPMQILYLNVLTDVFPALALGLGPGSDSVMRDRPRKRDTPILGKRHWLFVGGWSVFLATCVLVALGAGVKGLGLSEAEAVTTSFLTLGVGKLWFVFNLREPDSTVLDNNIVKNKWMWGALGVCGALLAAAVYVPGLSDVLGTRGIGMGAWGIVLVLSLLPMVAGQALLTVRRQAQDRRS